MTKNWGLAASAIAAMTLSAAPLAAQNYQPQLVKPAVDLEDLQAVVESLGHSVREVDKQSVFLVAEEKGGFAYVLEGTACDVNDIPGCQGIKMQVLYTLTPQVTDARLALANLEYAAVSVWAEAETETLGVTRYVVLDDGVTMANIRSNISVLLSIAPIAAETASGQNLKSDKE